MIGTMPLTSKPDGGSVSVSNVNIRQRARTSTVFKTVAFDVPPLPKSKRDRLLPPLSDQMTSVKWYHSVASYSTCYPDADRTDGTPDVGQLFRHGVRTPLLCELNGGNYIQSEQLNVNRNFCLNTDSLRLSRTKVLHEHNNSNFNQTSGRINASTNDDQPSSPLGFVDENMHRTSPESARSVNGSSTISHGNTSINNTRHLNGTMIGYTWKRSDGLNSDATDILYRNTYLLTDGEIRITPRSASAKDRPWSSPSHLNVNNGQKLGPGLCKTPGTANNSKGRKSSYNSTSSNPVKSPRKSKSIKIDDSVFRVQTLYRGNDVKKFTLSSQRENNGDSKNNDKCGRFSPASVESSTLSQSEKSFQLYSPPNEKTTLIEFRPVVIQRPLKQERAHYRPVSMSHPKPPVFKRSNHQQTERQYKSVEAYQRFLEGARQASKSPAPTAHRGSTAPSCSYMSAHEHNRMIQSVTDYNRPNPPPSPELKNSPGDVVTIPTEWRQLDADTANIHPTVVSLHEPDKRGADR